MADIWQKIRGPDLGIKSYTNFYVQHERWGGGKKYCPRGNILKTFFGRTAEKFEDFSLIKRFIK
jgi:hypothetical protein